MARKRKLTKVEKFGLIAVAVIVAFNGYLQMVYDPASQKLEEMRAQHAGLMEEVTALEDLPPLTGLRSEIAELEKTQSSLAEKLDIYMARGKMQTQEEVTQTLVAIKRLTLRHALSVVEILRTDLESPADPAVAGFIWQRYNLTLNGSYADLTSFVQSLEPLDAYVYIHHVIIEYEADKGLYKMMIALLI